MHFLLKNERKLPYVIAVRLCINFTHPVGIKILKVGKSGLCIFINGKRNKNKSSVLA